MNSMSEKMLRSGAIEGHVGNSSLLEQRIQYDDRASLAIRSLVSEIMDWSAAPNYKRHELECLLIRYEVGFASSEQMLCNSEKRNPESQIHETGPRSLQLRFLNKVGESTISTGVPIKAENCQPLRVALIDTKSGAIVTVGPEAFARVEIVALDPDFSDFVGDSWTPEEFKNKIVTKEGNKRLLSGNVVFNLKEGIGHTGIFQFSHTKHWMQKRAYRLGVIAMDDYVDTKIREGFTDSFFVKDHRLDLNAKHHPPNLYDEVWRLDGISRDGAFHKRLRDKEVNINTVEDLLKKLNTDPTKLRDILGKNMSTKMWDTLVEHARECIVDGTLYSYSSSEGVQEISVLFNMVGQVMGLSSDSCYASFEMLSESEKAQAVNLVVSAFQQWEKVIPLNDETSFNKFLGPRENVSPIMESSSSNILIPSKSYELALPQPATSFEDKVSVFDESPVASNKMINFPNYCELGFPNPDNSLDNNKEPPFDESPSQSFTVVPPNFPVNSATVALISQENIELNFPDKDTIHFSEPLGPSNVICSPISPIEENCGFFKTLMSSEIDSVCDTSFYNCYPQFADVANTDHGHGRHLSFSSQTTYSDNWEVISMTQSIEEENQESSLQFSVDDVPVDTMELSNYHKNYKNTARKRDLRNKAKKNWRILFSVVKWLFVPRKKFPVEHKNNSQALILSRNLKMNSEALQKRYKSKREKAQRRWTKLYSVMKWFLIQRKVKKRASSALTIRGPSSSSSLDDVSSNEGEFLQLFNTMCSLQPRDRIAMNKFARRRNVGERSCAHKKWRMLFSIAKWLLVRKSSGRLKRPYNNS